MPIKLIEEWIWESIPCSKRFEITINKDLYSIVHESEHKHKNWALYKNHNFITRKELPIDAALEANRRVKHAMQFFILSNKSDDDAYEWQWHILEKVIQSSFFQTTPVAKYKNKLENAEYILYANSTLGQIEIHRNIANHKDHIFTTYSMNEAFILSEKIGNLSLPIDIHKFASYSRNIDLIFNIIEICKHANMIRMNYSQINSYRLEVYGNTLAGHITTNGYMEYEKELNHNVYEVHRNISFNEMYDAFSNDYTIKEA